MKSSVKQMKCDIFLPESIASVQLKFLKIYDSGFLYKPDQAYSGYLGVEVDRIKLINFILELRKEGCKSFNVPVGYRDGSILTREDCFLLATDYAHSQGYGVAKNYLIDDGCPLYETFSIINDPLERAGGVVWVDKFDGHFWSLLEFEEYMHDYNGVLI